MSWIKLQPSKTCDAESLRRLDCSESLFQPSMSSKMTANQIIYFINRSPELLKIWRELDERSKRLVIEDCELTEESNFERVVKEVADGQRRLF